MLPYLVFNHLVHLFDNERLVKSPKEQHQGAVGHTSLGARMAPGCAFGMFHVPQKLYMTFVCV